MGFLSGLFKQGANHDYAQPGDPNEWKRMIAGLENFDPSGYDPSIGLAGKTYRDDVRAFNDPMMDITKNHAVSNQLNAIKTNTANSNAMAGRVLGTGDAALANSGHLADMRAMISNMNNNQAGVADANAISGARENSLQGYQNALQAKRQIGLGRAGLALGGKEAGVTAYGNSFRAPTSFNPSPFDIGKTIAGVAFG